MTGWTGFRPLRPVCKPTHSLLSHTTGGCRVRPTRSPARSAHALAAEIHAGPDPKGLQDPSGLKRQLAEVEVEIDERAAELWGLTEAELKEIQRSLEELG